MNRHIHCSPERAWGWRSGLLALFGLLAGCGSGPQGDGPPPEPIDVAGLAEPEPRVERRSRTANPPVYEVNGERYMVLADAHGYRERGIASWYGRKFHGRNTALGEVYDMYGFSAAHRSLPLPSYVRVTRLETGASVVVRVNDRGPFHPERLIDLSWAAAERLGITAVGTAPVEVVVLAPDAQADASGQWYLQVGAFTQAENAERMRRRLESDGFREVSVIAVPERGIQRVRVGPVTRLSELNALRERLHTRGYDTVRLLDAE
ncbi:MAG: septal ring lytic transglycosylase RlpA family protein [Chromatiales bacterium]|nr:septal ring lytic transglycosylase RlpA family protein [Chromatiales bacterium]